MQKKIIALAVAAVASSAAFAQSNVTVYGIVDAALTNTVATDKQNTIGMGSGLSTSRLGFKGVEDLGNGTKALFTLEYALATNQADGTTGSEGVTSNAAHTTNAAHTHTNGSGIGQARQAFVGATGNWGTAVAGRLQTAGYDWAVKFDPLAGSAVSALQAVNAEGSNATLLGATATAARANNALAYIAPAIYGVTLAVNHSVWAANTAAAGVDSVGQRANLYSATYNNGPLSVGYVLGTLASETVGNATTGLNAQGLGASYDFGVAKISATYQKQDETNLKADANKWTAQSLSAAVPVSAAGTVVLSLASKAQAGANAATGHDTTAQTLAYTHALSKRTTAYAAYRKVNAADGIAAGTDNETSLMAVGIRHAF